VIYHYGKYEPPLSDAIISYKYSHRKGLYKIFGKMICKYISDLNLPDFNYCVAYSPSIKKSVKEKGFIPAKMIAYYVSKYYGFKLLDLFENSNRLRQAQLDHNQRKENLKNKISLKTSPPESLIIIDDVFTTGSTFLEIARLIENKSKNVFGFTIAKADYKDK
jgi:competence protein ComFC